MEFKELFEIWGTKKGLFIYTGWLLIFFTGLMVPLLAIPQGLFTKFEILTYGGIVLSLVWLIYFIFWKIKRSVFILKKRVNIIFCYFNVTKTDSIKAYYNNFESDFREKIAELNIPQIKIVFWPMDEKIKNEVEAEKLVKKGYVGHTLMIWGELKEFSGSIECKKNHFSYEFRYQKYYPNLDKDKAIKLFGQAVQKRIDSINWNKNLANRKDFDAYAENIKEISLYILGRTLLTAGEFDKAIDVLTKLLNSIYQLDPVERRQRGQLLATLEQDLCIMHALKTMDFHKKDFEEIEYHCKLALKYNPSHYDSNVTMAYIQERKYNNECLAKQCLRKASLSAKRGQDAHRFSEAYMCLKHGDYEGAIQIYERLERVVDTAHYIPEIAEDFYEQFKLNKKPEFLFGEGFIKMLWMPSSGGRRLLKKFIRLTNSSPEDYKVLRDKATILST